MTLLVRVASAHELTTVLNPPELANSLTYGYSQAPVVSADAKLIHVAWLVGTSDTGPNDLESQVDRAFGALQAVLRVAGASAEDVVKTTLLVVDHDVDRLAYLIKKRKRYLETTPRPVP